MIAVKTAQQVFDEIAARKMVLDHHGLVKPTVYAPLGVKYSSDTYWPIDPEAHSIKMALKIIPLLIIPSERKLNVNSYWAKHWIENMLEDGHISNGEFILCMLMLGYKWKFCDKTTSPNVLFYALGSNSELIETICRGPIGLPKF